LTIAYREERETWAAELGGPGSDTGTLKETLTVTFIKRSYIIFDGVGTFGQSFWIDRTFAAIDRPFGAG
jgi:hypothetical protein